LYGTLLQLSPGRRIRDSGNELCPIRNTNTLVADILSPPTLRYTSLAMPLSKKVVVVNLFENILDLPKDLLHAVLQLISRDEAFFVALTCKAFRNAFSELLPRSLNCSHGPLPRSHKYMRFVTTVAAVGFRKERLRCLRPMEYDRRVVHHTTVGALSFGDSPCWVYRWNTATCNMLASIGALEALKWGAKSFPTLGTARTNLCFWAATTCARAARFGHLEVLKWAKEKGCMWDGRTCSAAAAGGHLEVLKWARNNRCPWCWLTCAYAAGAGQLEVLQWARANGCQWNESTCNMAAKGGHLTVLKWARSHGCQWDKDTCLYATEHGHLNVLKWALANGCECDAPHCYHASTSDCECDGPATCSHAHIRDWIKAEFGTDVYFTDSDNNGSDDDDY
jgi:hypothetical protein